MTAVATQLDARRLRRHESLAPYTTFRIGGPADLFYEAATAEELAAAVVAARSDGLPYFVLGLGANILIGDRGFRGLVIRNMGARTEWSDDGRVGIDSGAVMRDLILDAVHRGWSGLEHFVGIPSTVGGAVWQNLHFLSPAPERSRTVFLAEVFDSAEILSAEGNRCIVDRAYAKFGYDDSVFHHRDDIVLRATFALHAGDPTAMQRVLQENLAWRGARHPWLDWHPSAGSIFKKIDGLGAGRLLDQCGFKGRRIGGAQVSYLHANIIINLGGASAHDVRVLIAEAQQAVQERFAVQLEPEIRFVGEFS